MRWASFALRAAYSARVSRFRISRGWCVPAGLLCENPFCAASDGFDSLMVVVAGGGRGFTKIPLILVKIFLNTETLPFLESIISHSIYKKESEEWMEI